MECILSASGLKLHLIQRGDFGCHYDKVEGEFSSHFYNGKQLFEILFEKSSKFGCFPLQKNLLIREQVSSLYSFPQ